MHVSAVQIIDKNVFKSDKKMCYYNYMLKASFSPLLEKNLCCFSEHQSSTVHSCEMMSYSYNPMIICLCFTEANVWAESMELIMTALNVGETPLDL